MRLDPRPVFPILVFALLTVIVFSLLTWFLLWDYKKHALTRAEDETVAVTRMYIEQTERTFESIDLVLKGVQDRLQTEFGRQFSKNSLEVHLLLATRALGMRQLNSIYLVDRDHRVMNSSVLQGEQEYRLESSFIDTVLEGPEDRFYVDSPRLNIQKKEWFLHLARRVQSRDGKEIGVVVAAISVNYFESLYKFFRIQQARPVALYRSDGVLIASDPIRENLIGQRNPEISDAILAKLGKNIAFFTHRRDVNSFEQFTLVRVPDYPLLISVVNDTDEVIAAWRENSIPIIFALVFVTIFMITAAGFLSVRVLKERELRTALADAEGLYQHTVDSILDAIIATDGQQKITLFNPAAERMFGYRSDEVIGQSLTLLLPERFRSRHESHMRDFKNQEEKFRLMGSQLGIYGLRKDGEEFPIESTISRTEVGGVTQLTAVLRDVTDRRQTERELRDMNAQLRGLSASLQDVREQERSRIARELHDELGQHLTGLKLELSWLINRIKDGKELTLDKVDGMRQAIDQAISSVRKISTDLRPVILDDLGFGEAVAWLGTDFSQRTGVRVQLWLDAVDYVENHDLATALFRIVQESLTNVTRYAEAQCVTISLTLEEDTLVLQVSDDGVGLPKGKASGGFGWVSMRERANALGGKFSVGNNEAGGVSVRVSFDLDLPIFSVENS